MPNNLTGDYDAVLLVGVAKIDGILGTLHQNGADPEASPVFPHSEITRIGDRPKILDPPIVDYANWFNESLALANGGGGGGPPPGAKAPPGVAKILQKVYDDIMAGVVKPPPPPPVLNTRGTVEVQLSAPSIALPPGSTSEVTILVSVRAHFIPDANYPALPEPIHGLVSATYSVKTKQLQNYGSVKTILEVDPPTDDSKIQFASAANPGLSPDDVNQLAAQIRKALREGFEPVSVELPADFPFLQFKGVGNALALPIRLTPPLNLPASSLATVTNDFLGNDFSIGISRDYFQTQFQPTIDNLLQYRANFDVGYRWFSVTYHVSVTGVTIQWNNGSLDLVVKAKATASYAPDFDDITVAQRLTIIVDYASQHFFLVASDNDLSISGVWDFVKGHIRSAIIAARNNALPDAETQINNELAKNRTQLNNGLGAVDDSASARFSAVRITPDGLILDGDISTKFRTPPVVQIEETKDGTAFTAFKSWIPSGRIDRFEWSWVKHRIAETFWGGEVVTDNEADRFIFPKPAQISDVSSICLRIHGIQVDPHGFAYEVSAGTECSVSTPVIAWDMPSAPDPMPIPVWTPEVPLEGILEDYIQGHSNVLAHARPGENAANSVVHFVDPKMERPLEKIGSLLGQRKVNNPLTVIAVLSSGAFGARRREVEAKLGSLGKNFNGRLILTEDYTGSWKRTFDAKQMPSTYLMNTRGEFVWKQEGSFDPGGIAKALEKYLGVKRMVRTRRLNLPVQPGQRAPDGLFADDRGQRWALKKLRGHSLLVNFWRSWSAPSIRELQRLQSLYGKGGEQAPVVIAISGDQKSDVLAEIRRKNNLTFALVHDPLGLVARSYGVNCWPTTVSIGPDGIVNGVQVGAQHDHATGKNGKPSAAS